MVAVKWMDQAGGEEFQIEVELLSRLHSPYLLSLLGYCSKSSRKLLVYEFMENGGLLEHLYPPHGIKSIYASLDWKTRLRITLEAARSFEYLPEQVSPPVIHRDFESSNILLDQSFHGKCLTLDWPSLDRRKPEAMFSTRVLGTQSYVAPEYALTGHLTPKSVVYSYGVVLLELVSHWRGPSGYEETS
ncbi:hypothetical protein MLD38_015838 [Melastoma candidum]|uniref:Uncharacterized protein n=1 Tax=Melastoma candidum TaxID=119954 RepID=A0ACB9RIS9_9MYRT|nr:hypothetical protein MLD38_015838 [Melastoma candidum]